MIVLALDTSGGDCAACVYDSASDAVLGRVYETIGKGHAERLMGIVDKALEAANLDLKAVQGLLSLLVLVPSRAFVSVFQPRVALPCPLGLRLSA